MWIIRFIAISLLLAGPAWSAQDIVYSARYYYPPNVRSTSQFHIYRIDPDGRHRMQLTFGLKGDYGPKWSPNGKLIAFYRENGNDDSSFADLMVMDADGHRLRNIGNVSEEYDLSWNPDSNHLYVGSDQIDLAGMHIPKSPPPDLSDTSPDGRYRFEADSPNSMVVDVHTGKAIASTGIPFDTCAWLDNAEFVAVQSLGKLGLYEFSYRSIDGKAKRKIQMMQPREHDFGDREYYTYGSPFMELRRIPHESGAILGKQNWCNSTAGTEYGYFYLQPEKHVFHLLSDSAFISWSPDKRRYCSAPGRVISLYQSRKNGSNRYVWTAPLYVVDVAGLKSTFIQGGLVMVTSADWR